MMYAHFLTLALSPSLSLSVSLFVFLSLCLSLSLALCLSIRLSVCLSICLCVCVCVCVCVSLSLSLSASVFRVMVISGSVLTFCGPWLWNYLLSVMYALLTMKFWASYDNVTFSIHRTETRNKWKTFLETWFSHFTACQERGKRISVDLLFLHLLKILWLVFLVFFFLVLFFFFMWHIVLLLTYVTV